MDPGGADRNAGLAETPHAALNQVLFYAGMALIPIVIFGVLLFVAKHT